MKYSIVLLACCLAWSFPGRGQSFDIGDDVIGLTFGIGGHYSVYGPGYTSQSPAIGIHYEKGMSWEAGPGVIGLGAYVGYKSLRFKRYDYPVHFDYKWSYTILGARGAYHYEFLDNLDTYAGLLLAFNVVSRTDNTYADTGYNSPGYAGSGSDVGLTLFIGGKYYFSDNFAALLELGYGIAYLNLGVAYKF